jgi:hypothetical protein
MKTTLYPIILLLTMSLCTLSTFSQFDPLTNSFGTFPAAIPSSAGQTDNPISYSAASGVNCTDTTFWAIAGANVDLFTLNGTGIKKSGTTTITGGFDGNLAFCNNLDGGAFSPTFYSTQLYHKPVYYNGTGVTATSTTSRYYLISAGGYGNYLYYISADTVSYKSRAIVMYNSAGLTTVYNLPPSVIITAAGLAVDNYGNVWFLTGHDNDAFIADTLNVVSPLGHMVRQYPFSYPERLRLFFIKRSSLCWIRIEKYRASEHGPAHHHYLNNSNRGNTDCDARNNRLFRHGQLYPRLAACR